jgi:hypothetical protein
MGGSDRDWALFVAILYVGVFTILSGLVALIWWAVSSIF